MYSSLVNKLDHIGIGVSVLCAVHCTLLPVAVTILPLVGLNYLTHPFIELSIICTSLGIGFFSLGRSWRVHRSYIPFLLLGTGFLNIVIAHFGAMVDSEWIFLTMGSILISLAHLLNWKLLRQCACSMSSATLKND